MNKQTDILGRWVLISHVLIILLFNALFITAFHLANPLTIYAIGLVNTIVMVYNILYIRKIIYMLVAEKNKWKMQQHMML